MHHAKNASPEIIDVTSIDINKLYKSLFTEQIIIINENIMVIRFEPIPIKAARF